MQVVVEFALVDELGMLGVNPFGLHRHLKVGLGVDRLEDLTEGALTDLLDDLEVLAHFLQLLHLGNYIELGTLAC